MPKRTKDILTFYRLRSERQVRLYPGGEKKGGNGGSGGTGTRRGQELWMTARMRKALNTTPGGTLSLAKEGTSPCGVGNEGRKSRQKKRTKVPKTKGWFGGCLSPKSTRKRTSGKKE